MPLCLESLLVQLDERQSWIFEEVTRVFADEELQGALDAARDREQTGGELIAGGKRYRTLGGTFLRKLREFYPAKMGPVLKQQTALRRKEQNLRARRLAATLDGPPAPAPAPTIKCPYEIVGHIIGKYGVTINKFRKEYDCTIKFYRGKGVIRVDGPEDRAAKCREQLAEEIKKAIRATHEEAGQYYDAVLLSDLMCRKAATQEPWAAMLKEWVTEAVELTPASGMLSVLRNLAAKAPGDLVEEVSAQLEDRALLDAPEVTEAVLQAIRAGPATPDNKSLLSASSASLDLGDLVDAFDDNVWLAPDGEAYTKAKFLEEVGDEDMWLHELAMQAADSEDTDEDASAEFSHPALAVLAKDAETPVKEDKPDLEPEAGFETPLKDAAPQASPKASLTMKAKKTPLLKPLPGVAAAGTVLSLAAQFGDVVRSPRPLGTHDAD